MPRGLEETWKAASTTHERGTSTSMRAMSWRYFCLGTELREDGEGSWIHRVRAEMRVVPRGVTAPGHRPVSVVIGHRPGVFMGRTGCVTEERVS